MLISCPNHEWGENYYDWVKTGNGYESVGASKSTITKKTTHIEDEQPYGAVDGANHGAISMIFMFMEIHLQQPLPK